VPRRPWKDVVIEEQADELAAAKALIATLTDAADTYRLIAVEACARLHDRHVTQQRLEARLQALREELRRYTAAAVSAKVAA
jgi:hypothetical protein